LKRLIDRLFFETLRRLFIRGAVQEKRLLLVRTDGIGDLVYFERYVRAFAQGFPDHKVYLLCREECKGLAELFPPFRQVRFFQYINYRWNYLYRIIVLNRIRSLRPTTAVYCSYHRQHIGDEMTLLSGAKETIAFQGNDEIIHPATRRTNDRLYSTVIETSDHVSEDVKYRALLKRIGVDRIPSPSNFRVSLQLKDTSSRAPSVGPYFIIGVGGSSPLRRWPAERFSILGAIVAENTGWQPVLTGSENEGKLLGTVAERMKVRPRIIDGESLPAIVQLIASAKLFIGNESGLLHIAACLGTPALGILGGGHFTRYFPYGSVRIVSHKLPCFECNWKCPFPEPYCLTNISVDDVVAELKRRRLLRVVKS